MGLDDACEGIIENAWLGGSNWEAKVMGCAEDLKAWSSDKYGALFRELKAKRKKLRRLNKGGLSGSSWSSVKRSFVILGDWYRWRRLTGSRGLGCCG